MAAEIVDFIKVRSDRLRQSQAVARACAEPTARFAPLRQAHLGGLPAFSGLNSTQLGFTAAGSAQVGLAPNAAARANAANGAAFQFWTGVSGARYVHSVYHLFECPPVEAANYVLVKRHESGHRTVMAIGRAVNTAPSLNLAEIRQRASQLGANEVHVHLLAQGQDDSVRIEADLRGSLVLA